MPPGLEINEYGLIRGYAKPPLLQVNLEPVVTYVVATSSVNNTLTCLSTAGFASGRPIVFSGNIIGTVINEGQTYYVQSVKDGTTFTISNTVNGSVVSMTDDASASYMTTTLSGVSVGQPAVQSYSFTLQVESALGFSTRIFSITIVNQNTPVYQGGPGNPPNTRLPAVFNTRPETYNIAANIDEFGYYVLPVNNQGNTYSPSVYADIGTFSSNNIFTFKILGNDFDGNTLTYTFSSLPLGLVGDTTTGWITGTPIIGNDSISEYYFSVHVSKTNNPTIISQTFNFSFKISNHLSGNVTWLTPVNLGTVYNGLTSIKYVEAISDTPLKYRLIDGTLPSNLTLLENGELSGIVSFQPTNTLQAVNTSTDFTFSIQAYSTDFPIVNSTQTFTLSVYQEFDKPFDTLYCKCTPSIADRNLIRALLTDDNLIPTDYLYRSQDPFFGKATSVIYDHAYGIYANELDAYVAAILRKNYYWRNITLGELKTAIARDEVTGEILYEVVYSQVYDNLVNYAEGAGEFEENLQTNIITPEGESVSKEVYWSRFVPLFLGPWYTAETGIHASYIQGTDYVRGFISSTSAVNNHITYAALKPVVSGDAIMFLIDPNGNNQPMGGIIPSQIYYVRDVIDAGTFTISDTPNGDIVQLTTESGFMDLYTWAEPKEYYASRTPGFARVLYPNSLPNMRQQVVDVLGQVQDYTLLPLWMTSQQLNGSTLGYTPAWVIAYCKPGTTTLNGSAVSYADYIKYQIQNNWKNATGQVQTLNTINFKLDRFTVNKSATYDFNPVTQAWTELPSADPTPDPIDSDDFYVLFPRQTILPDETQYNR